MTECSKQKKTEEGFQRCKLCKKEVNLIKESNLFSHLKNHHKDIAANIDILDGAMVKKRAKLLLDCVELVAVNGNTLSHLL